MKQRKLKRHLIIRTLEDPDVVLPTRDGRQEAYKKFAVLYLKIVFIKQAKGITVITAHWVAKVPRT